MNTQNIGVTLTQRLSTPGWSSVGPYNWDALADWTINTNIGSWEWGNFVLPPLMHNPINIVESQEEIIYNQTQWAPIRSFYNFLRAKYKNDILAWANVIQVNLFRVRSEIYKDSWVDISEVIEKNIQAAIDELGNYPNKQLEILPSFWPAAENCYDPNTLIFWDDDSDLQKYIDFHKVQLNPVLNTLWKWAKILWETFNSKIDAKGFILAAQQLWLSATVSFAVDIDWNLVRNTPNDNTPKYWEVIKDLKKYFTEENHDDFQFWINCSPAHWILQAIYSCDKNDLDLIKIIYANSSNRHQSQAENWNVEVYSDKEKKLQLEFMHHISCILQWNACIWWCCWTVTNDLTLLDKIETEDTPNYILPREYIALYWAHFNPTIAVKEILENSGFSDHMRALAKASPINSRFPIK